MILVTGATGTVGRQLVRQLLDVGVAVRALSRHPQRAGLPYGVEVVGGDLTDAESLCEAVRGVDRVFLVTSGVDRVRQDANLADAARKAGVGRIVKLSALTVSDAHQDDAITRWHREGEQLIADSAMAWTFLRPGAFMSNALGWIATIKTQDAVFAPFAEVRTAAVDPRDVASVAAKVLAEDSHDGRTYELTGPELLSVSEQVDHLASALGRPLKVIEVPVEAARRQMTEAGMPEILADAVLSTQAHAGTGPGGSVTTSVAHLTGAQARSFSAWSIEHAARFGGHQ